MSRLARSFPRRKIRFPTTESFDTSMTAFKNPYSNNSALPPDNDKWNVYVNRIIWTTHVKAQEVYYWLSWRYSLELIIFLILSKL